MEERALFQAILAAPHDDAPRLVYADWLDENADRFPDPLARAERARAEFIRLQCAFARLAPEGWLAGPRPFAPELEKRERRLFLQYGGKWRRAFPVAMSSAPFDRGFLRPARAVRPQEFLEQLAPPHVPRQPLPALAPDSPARRFAPEIGSTLRTCPLWDIHLFASNWHNDPLADHGQYADLLAEVGRSPLLERVGWLKVSFFRTPVVEFLRTGHFANVETLVLNCGPSSEVLEAVAENESFRSLRYVRFGYDVWALAPNFAERVHVNALQDKLSVANARHVPFGEMRGVLRGIVRDTPAISLLPPPVPNIPAPIQRSVWAGPSDPAPNSPASGAWMAGVALVIVSVVLSITKSTPNTTPTPAFPTYQPITIPDIKLQMYQPYKMDPKVKVILKQIHENQSRPGEMKSAPGTFEPFPEVPLAPAPREVKAPDEK